MRFGVASQETPPARARFPRRRARIPACGAAAAVLLLLLAALGVRPAAADPDYGRPILYGIDPVLRSTDDPRLLGAERLVIRHRLERMGVDPLRDGGARPTLMTRVHRYWRERANVDLRREEFVREYNGPLGLAVEIRHPTFFYLFPAPETLPGGFVYYPPRPTGDPVVQVFIDDIDAAMARRHHVTAYQLRTEALDLTGPSARADKGTNLINLTIPIKLPRTLEKIIGKGEKTRIKITGRERIALSGESTVVKPFVGNERVSSQSLFPTLDMEQELQINLSGVIGEKIIIEVDHNSAAIGPDATKIKLMYQGTEDEIIKTIETGDVGLTLPGSQLLGYSSNKSGLFGIKVTGQLGRADFTVVASKQKAEASSKTFNAQGGQLTDHVILSSDYLNNRFFNLDLPLREPQGRVGAERILISSVKIFQAMGPGQFQEGDIANVAVYVDSLGFRAWNESQMDFADPYEFGQRWREITGFDPLLDADGRLVAVDMRSRMTDDAILAVVYDVVTADGTLVQRVGDNPDQVTPVQEIPGGEGLYYRMKLLKGSQNKPHPHVFDYVLRNIYSLGGANIDPTTFELRIERDTNELTPWLDENGLDYIRIFGLDRDNPQRTGTPDGAADIEDPLIFDLTKGLLKFPLDFLEPFAAGEDAYRDYADTTAFTWENTFLAINQTPQLYDPGTSTVDYPQYGKFRLVSSHASASSSFNLGVSNIEEGSETVTLDGRTLQRGVDYEIDYVFGELQLKGEAANLTPDSKIGVTYQYAPFIGGGNTSLMGLNLGYDLGRDSKLATTWLYQTESIVGEKAKLGEEPSKTLVGNVNLQHTVRPGFLTTAANILSRRDSDRESSVQFSGEMAVSLPNPNTKNEVYLEDFEGVDASDIISLTRTAWSWASAPFLGERFLDENPTQRLRTFTPQTRVGTVRWFLPRDRVLRRYLNPDLVNQERDETQQAMDLYLRADDGVWGGDDWGGIMRGISRTGLDLSKAQFVEIWVNDKTPDIAQRQGRLHIDFGYVNEDGFWPAVPRAGLPDSLVVGRFEQEDGILPGQQPDGVWTYDEDIGLDGNESGPQLFGNDYEIGGDSPFPRINGTARNNREDSEDLNANTRLDTDNGFFTVTIDLRETEALVDVVYDYDDVSDLVAEGHAWRKYRIPMAALDEVSEGTAANIRAVTHARIWYENDDPAARSSIHLQLSEFKFLGSRWEREGVRRVAGEQLLSPAERLPGEEFYLGEVNNKENPDYYPPFTVRVENNIPEKEQALVLNFENLDQGHLMRSSKQVSPRGDDYTGYRDLSWYWYNPSAETADVDLFFRVGSDSLNYYEVSYRFADGPSKVGWKLMDIGLAELSNVKNEQPEDDGTIVGQVPDFRTGEMYDVRVVGRPDLRRVRRYYFGVANRSLTNPASGYVYLNDVRLGGVKKDMGIAQRAGVRLNMADVIKVDADWKFSDAEFHGLDSRTGSGEQFEDWNVSTSFSLDDFVPLLGFRLPVALSRRQTVQRPKYVVNSDIEIIDEDVRNLLSTVDTQERFTTRLNHTPSKAALLRYLIDPWTLQVNGSRQRRMGPLEQRNSKTLQGSLNYDLRIPGNYQLGNYPLLNLIPVVKGVTVVPRRVALGSSFNSTYQEAVTITSTGQVTPRPTVRTRPGRLTAGFDYDPLPIADFTFNAASERDLLRERMWNGVNIGEENRRNYDYRATFKLPKAGNLPQSKLFAPLRAANRELNKMRPTVQYTGSFTDQHDPAVRQPGDPEDIRSVSNSGSWDLRFDLPVDGIFKTLFPERKFDQSQRQQLVEQQRRLENQQRRSAGRNQPPAQDPATGGAEGDPSAVDDVNLTPEERRRREEERLLEAAEERLEQEREQGLAVAEPPAEQESAEGGPSVSLWTLFNPVLNALRNTSPVKVTYTTRDQSSFARLQKKADFWYSTGLTTDIDAPDSLYSSSALSEQTNLSISTSSKLTRSVSLDVKYADTQSMQTRVGAETRNLKTDWPDAQIAVSGLEKWGLFGGNAQEIDSGWFRSSTLNFSYKRSKAVNNYTATVYNPSVITTFSPRWTMTFHSGLTATLTANVSNSEAIANGSITTNSKQRYGLQMRHQFEAAGFLSKLGLYRPGSSQNLNMDVDLSYQTDRSERETPGRPATAPTGTNRISVNPRFSYQITRNLSGSLRFIYGRTRNIATNQTTTSLGLGVEAIFVF